MRMRQRKVSTKASDDDENNEKFTATNYLPKNFSPSLKKIFVLCLVTRMINSLLVQTYFNPDEHWQALEVGHRIAFGYTFNQKLNFPNVVSLFFPFFSLSFLSFEMDFIIIIIFYIGCRYGHLTWEWKKGIRTYLHPVLFAALYKVLAFSLLDTPWFMVILLSL